MYSSTVEDYLKSIYLLGQSNKHVGTVTTTRLAERLKITPASVTCMIQRLARSDPSFVEYTPYKGVLLTAHGENAARKIVRKHRLLELYLVERLGLHQDEVHDEAERLEHHVSAYLEECIADALGNPQTDPHGQPIPAATP